MKMVILAACAIAQLSVSGAIAENSKTNLILIAGASSCSGWKAICETRGPGCDAKFSACLKSGCWQEGQKYGGATHCGLAKK